MNFLTIRPRLEEFPTKISVLQTSILSLGKMLKPPTHDGHMPWAMSHRQFEMAARKQLPCSGHLGGRGFRNLADHSRW